MSTDELTALENDESVEPSTSGPGRSGLFAGVAMLLALGALALAALAWLEDHDSPTGPDPEVQARLQGIQQEQARNTAGLTQLSERLEDMAGRSSPDQVSDLETSVSEQSSLINELTRALENQETYNRSLQQAIDSLQARLRVAEAGLAAQAPQAASAPSRFDLASVEYLLRLAPERLVLFYDIEAADEALVLADAQLAAMENPIYIGLRQHISDARITLTNTELPNTIEISSRLDDAQNMLAGLTFGSDPDAVAQTTSSTEETAEEQGWWQRLKNSLSNLVTVRRSTTEAGERLTIEDKDMLRQGLWMQIEGARLALMRHDQDAWAHSLGNAERVLERWFDSASEEYLALSNELSSLADLSIAPELPDISGPWAQLQLIRQASGTAFEAGMAAPSAASESGRREDTESSPAASAETVNPEGATAVQPDSQVDEDESGDPDDESEAEQADITG